jgi:nicotinamidase-related amidase
MSACFAADRSAILLVEFQNQWTLRGPYHRLIRDQLATRRVLANAQALVRGARERGVAIVHAPLVIDPLRKRGWLAHASAGRLFTRGTWKAEITDGLFRPGDHVVRDRYAFDAFAATDLETTLRALAVTHLFVGGFTTDQCVARTLRTAVEKGFDAHLVSDCTATFGPWFQRRVEREFASRVVDHEALLSKIEGGTREIATAS